MQDTTKVAEQLMGLLHEQTPTPKSLSAMEAQTRELALEIQRQALELWLAQVAAVEEQSDTIACACGPEAVYLFRRMGVLRTLFGEVRYKRRYYLCAACHSGAYPLDEQLGLRPNAISAEVERLSGLVGVQMAFEKGSGVFEELTLLPLSDQTLDKAAQAYGAEVRQQEAAWHAQAHDYDELQRRARAAKRPRRLYGAIDGLKTRIRTEKDDDEPWRELKLGAWFVARGQPPSKPDGEWRIKAEQMTYYTDICHKDEFGELAWATGFQHNAHLAEELILLGDGARWIWDLVDEHFPDAIQIVDWFHACEYIAPVAKVAFRDKEKQKAWSTDVKTALWEGRLDDVIAACEEHVDPEREKDPAQKAVTYYTNNRARMDYPTYRANGYQIGSGTVESAAKQIGQQRMKIAGARWNLDSARKVAKARAAFLSGQWLDLAARRTHLPLAV